MRNFMSNAFADNADFGRVSSPVSCVCNSLSFKMTAILSVMAVLLIASADLLSILLLAILILALGPGNR